MAEVRVRIDDAYTPRGIFLPFHKSDRRWSCLVAHRRAGKTVACVNQLMLKALACRRPSPRFAYIAPFYNQAKDIAWSYVRQYTACIPGVEYNESELRADLPGGARIRLYGADNYERLRGVYFDGIILDEYGDMDPRAWSEVIRPALSDRQGWAVFIGTPKGRNHFCELWEGAQPDPAWYALMLKASATGILPTTELDDARRSMTPAQYEQEYECSFEAAVIGSYYGDQMKAAAEDSRIGRVTAEPTLPVHTAWDLGIGDSTAIWIFQLSGNEIRVIDYIEHAGVGLDWYARELDKKAAQGSWKFGDHILPHDAKVRELGTGRSRVETLQGLGINPTVLEADRIEDGINAVRTIIPRTWFDADKCKHGLEALRQYRRE